MFYFKVDHDVALQINASSSDLLAGQIYIAPEGFKDILICSLSNEVNIVYLTDDDVKGSIQQQPLDLHQFSTLPQGQAMELMVEWSNRRAVYIALMQMKGASEDGYGNAFIRQMVDVLNPLIELIQKLELGINVHVDFYTDDESLGQSQVENLFPNVIIRSQALPVPQDMWEKYNLVACREGAVSTPKSRSIPSFDECFEAIRERNILPLQDAHDLYNMLLRTNNIVGDVAEIGVYRGASSHMIANLLKNTGKQIFLFDTFDGMPETSPGIDMIQKGGFNDTSLGQVQQFLASFANVHFHPGLFPKTLTSEHEKLYSFVHIDCDIYQSTLDACHFFYPLMNRGGIMLFHDYLTYDCPGVKKAVDEFFCDKDENPQVLGKLYCCVVKQDINNPNVIISEPHIESVSIQKTSSPKILLLSAYTYNIKGFGEISEKSIAAYAMYWSYDYKIYHDGFDGSRHPVWSKMRFALNHINEYDYILWIDADAMIVNYGFDLQSVIEEGTELYLCNDRMGINFGVFMIHCSAYSKDLMDKIDAQRHFIGIAWQEQSALTYLYTTNWNDLQSKTKFIKQSLFNSYVHQLYNFSYPDGEFELGYSFIVHFPAIKAEFRQKMMGELLEKT
ncbi:MAG: TylF/MycF/NovP-related O-methyltransferase, partial [Candidatus Margulisiibacteriota bacterium]